MAPASGSPTLKFNPMPVCSHSSTLPRQDPSSLYIHAYISPSESRALAAQFIAFSVHPSLETKLAPLNNSSPPSPPTLSPHSLPFDPLRTTYQVPAHCISLLVTTLASTNPPTRPPLPSPRTAAVIREADANGYLLLQVKRYIQCAAMILLTPTRRRRRSTPTAALPPHARTPPSHSVRRPLSHAPSTQLKPPAPRRAAPKTLLAGTVRRLADTPENASLLVYHGERAYSDQPTSALRPPLIPPARMHRVAANAVVRQPTPTRPFTRRRRPTILFNRRRCTQTISAIPPLPALNSTPTSPASHHPIDSFIGVACADSRRLVCC
ncbi:hypothetical protein R3P38DRAFT_3343173 [Favolaschia claudopus]|uniref:Uncharacterized protein n=1 Tax=Favolaschia claudopus TaxID=2862362 RepID=A0AAW0DP81_9AGAR